MTGPGGHARWVPSELSHWTRLLCKCGKCSTDQEINLDPREAVSALKLPMARKELDTGKLAPGHVERDHAVGRSSVGFQESRGLARKAPSARPACRSRAAFSRVEGPHGVGGGQQKAQRHKQVSGSGRRSPQGSPVARPAQPRGQGSVLPGWGPRCHPRS